MVRVLDFESVGPGFESHSDHGFVSRQSRVINPSAALVNSQLVCLPPVGILKTCYFSFAIFVSFV